MPPVRDRFPTHLLAPRRWPEWLGIALVWLAARLPLRTLMALGWCVGVLATHLLPARRRIAEINLRVCFPELNAVRRRRLLRANLRNLGLMLAEFSMGWMGSARALSRVPAHIDGLEHLRAAQATGRGVLLVGAHFTHLELCARLLAMHVPLAGMYRVMDSPVFERIILRARLRYAAAMFTKDDLLGTVRHLRRGGVLWYAPDQDMRGKDSVFAPFFGVPAATITATHHLARLSGAVVLPFAHRREHDGSYRIDIRPALDDFPSADIVADTTRVNLAIEHMVRAVPAQYLWVHKRFKRRPDGYPPLY